MIYLIRTTYYDSEIIDLLKIGYTGGSNKQGRIKCIIHFYELFENWKKLKSISY